MLLMFLPFEWLLFESTKKTNLTQDALPSDLLVACSLHL